MPERAHDKNDRDSVGRQLLRLAASPDNRSRLQALPQLKPETRLPGDLRKLLKRLEQAERR